MVRKMDRDESRLSQESYVLRVAERFGMIHAKANYISMGLKTNYNDELEGVDAPHREALGSLMHSAMESR